MSDKRYCANQGSGYCGECVSNDLNDKIAALRAELAAEKSKREAAEAKFESVVRKGCNGWYDDMVRELAAAQEELESIQPDTDEHRTIADSIAGHRKWASATEKCARMCLEKAEKAEAERDNLAKCVKECEALIQRICQNGIAVGDCGEIKNHWYEEAERRADLARGLEKRVTELTEQLNAYAVQYGNAALSQPKPASKEKEK